MSNLRRLIWAFAVVTLAVSLYCFFDPEWSGKIQFEDGSFGEFSAPMWLRVAYSGTVGILASGVLAMGYGAARWLGFGRNTYGMKNGQFT